MGLEPTTPCLQIDRGVLRRTAWRVWADERCLWHRMNAHEPRRMFPKFSIFEFELFQLISAFSKPSSSAHHVQTHVEWSSARLSGIDKDGPRGATADQRPHGPGRRW